MDNVIEPLKKQAKEYTKIFGHCDKCRGPIWFSRIIDNTGTPLLAYHCWNGHYEAIDPQILDIYRRGGGLSKEDVKRILPFIKFIRRAG